MVLLVGMTRFERAASWTQTSRATKLRHIPLGTDGGSRTPNARRWRPLLYQLSYIRRSATVGQERIEPVASLELATFSLED